MQTFILPKLAPREGAIARIGTILGQLGQECAWAVRVEEHRPTRSGDQNRLLWAIYGEILQKGGEAMAGWTKDDLHSFFLINHFGSEVKELFGRKRHIPLRRSSRLNRQEFADLIESILMFMAERGVFIETQSEAA
jgi:NinB protein